MCSKDSQKQIETKTNNSSGMPEIYAEKQQTAKRTIARPVEPITQKSRATVMPMFSAIGAGTGQPITRDGDKSRIIPKRNEKYPRVYCIYWVVQKVIAFLLTS